MNRLPLRYLTALRSHLKEVTDDGLPMARRLGGEAAETGLVGAELVAIHERAVLKSGQEVGKDGECCRREAFLVEFLLGFGEGNRTAGRGVDALKRVEGTLGRCNSALDVSKREVNVCKIRGRRMAKDLRKSEELNVRLLKDSLGLPEGLRELTHRIILAQEEERLTMSHQMQDEIVQILVAIQVRLAALKSVALVDRTHLAREIGVVQQLVVESIRLINRFAREISAQT